MKKPLRKFGRWVLRVSKNPTVQQLAISFLRSRYIK
jgi:hypothetical protein